MVQQLPGTRDSANPWGRFCVRRDYFVKDAELGWARFDADSRNLVFFDSPVGHEFIVPAIGRNYRQAQLPEQERAWWFDGDRWMVGRVDSPSTAELKAYYVHFPNGRTELVSVSDLRVRWSKPLRDPLSLLKSGTVETRFFHSRRTRFLRNVSEQRSASRGLGGLLSSGVEIHDHQVGAARRVLSDPVPRYLLADEVGLGKTIEAGMVLRQLLLDSEGSVAVIVPDAIVGQWRSELLTKFRIHEFPDRVEVVGHSDVEGVEVEDRLLTVVDEAHRFTDYLKYDGHGARVRQYEALRAVAHASKALLLLSATPVRSNEDAFLGLLHLLDPANYPLSDVDAFRRRVEMRDELAQAMSSFDEDTPLRYLDEPLQSIAELLGEDRVVAHLVSEVRRFIAERRAEEARAQLDQLRIHVSETYRLHRRMIRNRRATVVKRLFPARGRALATPWTVEDPDPRRDELFRLLDHLRLDLELSGHPDAGAVLQVVFGRCLAPLQALEDLVLALCGKTEHDLSTDEMAIITAFRDTDVGRGLARGLEQLLAVETEVDRLSAMVDWARRRVGRGKYAITCTFPRTAGLAADLLIRELGRHRVTALLEGQDDSDRNRLVAEFARSSERSILVIDRSAEEGTNLQFIDEVMHLDVPTTTSRLEQRLGRFDRWSEIGQPVRSVAFGEAHPDRQAHLGAWTATLSEVFGVFGASTSTLQYVLSDLEAEFFRIAVTRGFAEAGELMRAQAGALEDQRRQIAGQDLLDSIEDHGEDEEFAERLAEVDSKSRAFERVVVDYVHEMLKFQVAYGNDDLRFRVDERNPPLLSRPEVRAIGPTVFQQAYTADRITASEGRGFLRWGVPLIDAFANFAESDDRGRAFAVEVEHPVQQPGLPPLLAFCFDIALAPGDVDPEADEAFRRAVLARTSLFLPTTIERVWWRPGAGECPPKMIADLERREGINLGSRPDRFRELTRDIDWPRRCDEAGEAALAAVHGRPHVVERLATAAERAAQARVKEVAILKARSRTDGVPTADYQVMAAVEDALTNPVFTLESCGGVIITRVHRS
jgi:ATP-dependent helicase HepA